MCLSVLCMQYDFYVFKGVMYVIRFYKHHEYVAKFPDIHVSVLTYNFKCLYAKCAPLFYCIVYLFDLVKWAPLQ